MLKNMLIVGLLINIIIFIYVDFLKMIINLFFSILYFLNVVIFIVVDFYLLIMSCDEFIEFYKILVFILLCNDIVILEFILVM